MALDADATVSGEAPASCGQPEILVETFASSAMATSSAKPAMSTAG
jgi:hypothetical protein